MLLTTPSDSSKTIGILQVLNRSDRGSSWIEVDLRFKLSLGPIRVSGVTTGATLNNE
jgi:hypothetical protein